MDNRITYPTGKSLSLQEVFGHEEHDFNPVLREAIGSFGQQVFGFDLEVVDYEEQLANGGDLNRYDILAKESRTETFILVEIQYGRFNHDHITRSLEYVMNLDKDIDFAVCLGESFSKNTIDLIYEYFDEILLPVQMSLEAMVTSGGDEIQPALRFSTPENDSGIIHSKANEMLVEARRDLRQKVTEQEMESPQVVLNRAEAKVEDIDGLVVDSSRDDRLICDVIPEGHTGPISGTDLKLKDNGNFMRLRSPFFYREDKEVIEEKMGQLKDVDIDDLVGMEVSIKRRHNIGRRSTTGIWIIYNKYENVLGNEEDIVEDFEKVGEALTGKLGQRLASIVNP